MSEHEREHPSVVGQNGAVGLVIDAVLGVVSLMMLLPLVFLISNAFKTPPELLAWPPTVIPHQPTLENIVSVLRETPLFRWIGNSLIFATLSTASIVSTSAIAGYVLGKFDLPGIPVIFGVIIATAVVPFEVYMIPLYLNVQSAGLLNTWPGLLVGYLIMSFGIFLVRQ
jgi:multiple sugar transport system permease protein